jgi:CheY-like chemotaxis protein
VRYGAGLKGYRVLVVEDEFLLALELERLLQRQGCVVLGPVWSVDRALALLGDQSPDGAVLDVNLRGRRVAPVAAALRERGVPFVLVTGYGEDQLGEPELQGRPRLNKPLDWQHLLCTLARVLEGA